MPQSEISPFLRLQKTAGDNLKGVGEAEMERKISYFCPAEIHRGSISAGKNAKKLEEADKAHL